MQAVIAKSYAFIYERNQSNMVRARRHAASWPEARALAQALLGIKIADDRFYALAQEGATVRIDVAGRAVAVLDPASKQALGQWKFDLSTIEENLLAGGGVGAAAAWPAEGAARGSLTRPPPPRSGHVQAAQGRAVPHRDGARAPRSRARRRRRRRVLRRRAGPGGRRLHHAERAVVVARGRRRRARALPPEKKAQRRVPCQPAAVFTRASLQQLCNAARGKRGGVGTAVLVASLAAARVRAGERGGAAEGQGPAE